MVVDTTIGENTKIYDPELSNIRGATIGSNCVLHSHIWIGEGVKIGDNVKIQAFTFIPAGVEIGNDVLIGPGVTFTNDKYPEVSKERGSDHWEPERTIVRDGVSIGARATILCGLTIGEGAKIGAGAVVTKDIPGGVVACGVPARIMAGRSKSDNTDQ